MRARDQFIENPDLEREEGPVVEEWRDSLGQVFRAEDLVMVATVSGRSPQMVVAEVVRINTHSAKGERHTKIVRTGKRVTLTRPVRKWTGPAEFENWHTAIESLEESPLRRASQQKQRERMAEFRRAQSDQSNWEVSEESYETDEMWEVQAVTVTAKPLLDGRGFGRSDPSKRWMYDADTGHGWHEEIEDAPRVRNVTYSIIGNIIKVPEELRRLLEGAEPGRRDVNW